MNANVWSMDSLQFIRFTIPFFYFHLIFSGGHMERSVDAKNTCKLTCVYGGLCLAKSVQNCLHVSHMNPLPRRLSIATFTTIECIGIYAEAQINRVWNPFVWLCRCAIDMYMNNHKKGESNSRTIVKPTASQSVRYLFGLIKRFRWLWYALSMERLTATNCVWCHLRAIYIASR